MEQCVKEVLGALILALYLTACAHPRPTYRPYPNPIYRTDFEPAATSTGPCFLSPYGVLVCP